VAEEPLRDYLQRCIEKEYGRPAGRVVELDPVRAHALLAALEERDEMRLRVTVLEADTATWRQRAERAEVALRGLCGRVEREAFVLELERLAWPLSEAAELADLVCECEVLGASSAPAIEAAQERGDGLG